MNSRRAIEIFLNRTAGPVITYILRAKIAPSESQIEKELAAEYGRIADRMVGQEVKVVNVEAEPISVNYCLECLQRHYEKAHGLLEEAERFSLGGKLTPEAAQKVRKAVEELVTSEDDLDSTGAPPEVRAKLDEIEVKMRDVRKEAWRDRLSFEGAPLDALGKAKAGVDDLLRRTYDLMAEETKREEGMAGTAPPPLAETPETKPEAPPAGGHEAEREVLEHLGEFERTEDTAHLERANEAAKRTRCIACRKYLKAALLAAKEGKMKEARGWVSGVKRGIQATLP